MISDILLNNTINYTPSYILAYLVITPVCLLATVRLLIHAYVACYPNRLNVVCSGVTYLALVVCVVIYLHIVYIHLPISLCSVC